MPKFIDENEKTPRCGCQCEQWVEDVSGEPNSPKTSLPKCPICNEDIRILLTSRPTIVTGKIAYNYDCDYMEDVEPEILNHEEELTNNSFIIFKCPYCNKPLFDCPEDANKFFYDHKLETEEEEC